MTSSLEQEGATGLSKQIEALKGGLQSQYSSPKVNSMLFVTTIQHQKVPIILVVGKDDRIVQPPVS